MPRILASSHVDTLTVSAPPSHLEASLSHKTFASDNPSATMHARPRPQPRCSSLVLEARFGLAFPTGKCCTIMAYSRLHSRSEWVCCR